MSRAPSVTPQGYAVNTSTYEAKYQAGYGLQYPDGHVIRFHRHILEYELGLSSGTILDYGCGTGTHLRYFEQQGFTPYGCDISATAIAKCKRLLPAYADHFHVVPNSPRLKDYFPGEFDLVFSNQVLYYLNDADLDQLIPQFYRMLRPGGVIFATMMAPTSYYFRHIADTERGLSKVVLKGRLNETTYINFKTKEQVLSLFTAYGFTRLHLGLYGSAIRDDEGPTDHYMFVGRRDARPA